MAVKNSWADGDTVHGSDLNSAADAINLAAIFSSTKVSGISAVLPASTDYVTDAQLEIDSDSVIEIPATSSLEVSTPSTSSDIATKAYADLNVKPTATKQDTTLTASLEHLANNILEIGSSYFLEIPSTSTLEVATYSPPLSGAQTAFVVTDETTTSTGYVDLTTTTDQVTVTIGPSGMALVCINVAIAFNALVNGKAKTSFAVSGATTLAASLGMEAIQQSTTDAGGTSAVPLSGTYLVTSLNPGATTFKMKYSADVNGGTAHFIERRIAVIPL